jgi:hypothetical protein
MTSLQNNELETLWKEVICERYYSEICMEGEKSQRTWVRTTLNSRSELGTSRGQSTSATGIENILLRSMCVIIDLILDMGFIDHLQIVTTNNYNTTADFHPTKHYTLSLLSCFH